MSAPGRRCTRGRLGRAPRLLGAGKRFAWLLIDHHDDERIALCVKAPPVAQETLVRQGDCCFVPAYVGSDAWVGIDVAPDASVDWDVVSLPVEQARRMCAPKRLVAQLEDARPRVPFRVEGR